jgi:hypothetical protein
VLLWTTAFLLVENTVCVYWKRHKPFPSVHQPPTEWTSVICIKGGVPPSNLQTLLQCTVCIFFTAFTKVGTHSCITRIWCTLLHHNKGRVSSFTVQLRQLRPRGDMPCGGCTQRVSERTEHLSSFSEIKLTAEHFFLRKHSETFPLRT